MPTVLNCNKSMNMLQYNNKNFYTNKKPHSFTVGFFMTE